MSLSHDPRIRQVAKELCRKLRSSQTNAENILWEAIRNRKICESKFYRQYPIFFDYLGKETFYIADFFCYQKKLVVEIDGEIHNYKKNKDKLRTFIINMLGMRVIRFNNNEIEHDLENVLEKLKSQL